MIILFLFNFNSNTSFLSRLVRMVKSKLPDAVLPEIPLHQLIFANLNQHADKISFVSMVSKMKLFAIHSKPIQEQIKLIKFTPASIIDTQIPIFVHPKCCKNLKLKIK